MGEVSIFRGGWEVKKRILAVFIVLAILASLVISVLPVSAAGSVLVDQQEYTETTNFNFTNGHDLAQDFYPQSSYYIDKIAVRLAGITETTGNVNLSLYNVSGSTWIPNVLVSASTPIPVVDIQLTASQYYTFQMLTPIFITQGQVYSIVLSVDSGNTITWYFGPYLNSLNYPSYHLTSGSWFPNGANINFDYDIYGTQTAAPTWQTQAASSPASDTTMTLNGLVTSLGSYTNVIGQFSWGLASNAPFTSFTSPTFSVLANHQYSFLATGLAPGTAYIYAFMLTYGGNVGNGGNISFSTTGTATTTTTPTVTVPTTTTTTTSSSIYTLYEGYAITTNEEDVNIGGGAGNHQAISMGFQGGFDYQVQQVAFRMWQSVYNYSPGNITISLFASSSNGRPTGLALDTVSTTTSQILKGTSRAIAASWVYFTLPNSYLIVDGNWYCWVITTSGLSNSFNIVVSEASGGNLGNVEDASVWTTIIIVGDTKNLLFKNYGSSAPIPVIKTNKITIENGKNLILSGTVVNMGPDTSVTVDFLYGSDTNYGNDAGTTMTAAAFTGSTQIVTQNMHTFTCVLTGWSGPIYAIAYMTGNQTGIVTGLTGAYQIGQAVPTSTSSGPGGNPYGVSLLTAKPSTITQTSAYVTGTIVNMGLEDTFTTVEIQIDSLSDFSHNNTPIILGRNVLSSDVNGEGQMFTAVPVTGLSAGTHYYVRMAAFGSLQTDPYLGNTQPLVTSIAPNGHGSTGADWITNIFNKIGLGAGFWWVIIFILMIVPWLVKPIREHAFIGIIMDFVVLGAGIALVLDSWLVVLLAIPAAVIIFFMIKGRSTAGA
jgi:hypothetical protein